MPSRRGWLEAVGSVGMVLSGLAVLSAVWDSGEGHWWKWLITAVVLFVASAAMLGNASTQE